jgi:hypothetical protein
LPDPWKHAPHSKAFGTLLTTFLYPTVSNDRFGLNTASQPWIQNIAQIERSESSMLFRDKAMSAKLNLNPSAPLHSNMTRRFQRPDSALIRSWFGPHSTKPPFLSNEGRISSLWGPNQLPMSSELPTHRTWNLYDYRLRPGSTAASTNYLSFLEETYHNYRTTETCGYFIVLAYNFFPLFRHALVNSPKKRFLKTIGYEYINTPDYFSKSKDKHILYLARSLKTRSDFQGIWLF